jgi:integrase
MSRTLTMLSLRMDVGPQRPCSRWVSRHAHGGQAGVTVYPHRFRHHFCHTWLDRGGAEGDLMELNGWSSPQMLQRYGGSARGARARRHYDLIMKD